MQCDKIFPCFLNDKHGIAFITYNSLYRALRKDGSRSKKDGNVLMPKWEKGEACFLSIDTLSTKSDYTFQYVIKPIEAFTTCTRCTSIPSEAELENGCLAFNKNFDCYGLVFASLNPAAFFAIGCGESLEQKDHNGEWAPPLNSSILPDLSDRLFDPSFIPDLGPGQVLFLSCSKLIELHPQPWEVCSAGNLEYYVRTTTTNPPPAPPSANPLPALLLVAPEPHEEKEEPSALSLSHVVLSKRLCESILSNDTPAPAKRPIRQEACTTGETTVSSAKSSEKGGTLTRAPGPDTSRPSTDTLLVLPGYQPGSITPFLSLPGPSNMCLALSGDSSLVQKRSRLASTPISGPDQHFKSIWPLLQRVHWKEHDLSFERRSGSKSTGKLQKFQYPSGSRLFIAPLNGNTFRPQCQIENLQVFFSKEALCAHVEANSCLLLDWVDLWPKLQKAGWTHGPLAAKTEGSGTWYQYPTPTPTQGVSLFRSAIALTQYCHRYPIPLQDDTTLSKTLNDYGWVQSGKFRWKANRKGVEVDVEGLEKIRNMLWGDPMCLFSTLDTGTRGTGMRDMKDAIFNGLALDAEFARREEHHATSDLSSPPKPAAGVSTATASLTGTKALSHGGIRPPFPAQRKGPVAAKPPAASAVISSSTKTKNGNANSSPASPHPCSVPVSSQSSQHLPVTTIAISAVSAMPLPRPVQSANTGTGSTGIGSSRKRKASDESQATRLNDDVGPMDVDTTGTGIGQSSLQANLFSLPPNAARLGSVSDERLGLGVEAGHGSTGMGSTGINEKPSLTLRQALTLTRSSLSLTHIPSPNPVRRSHEFATLYTACKQSLATRQGCAVYICGQPGTGKTLTTGRVLARLQGLVSNNAKGGDEDLAPSEFHLIKIQGTACTGKSIFQSLADALAQDHTGKGLHSDNYVELKSAVTQALLNHTGNKRMILLCIDEIDRAPMEEMRMLLLLAGGWFDSKGKNNAPMAPSSTSTSPYPSRLILIGLANTISFPSDLAIPTSMQPLHILFPTYDPESLYEILEQRTCGLYESQALNFVSRKMEKIAHGDVRALLDMAQQIVDSCVQDLCNGSNDAATMSVLLDAPAYPFITSKACVKIFQRAGLGTSREPALIAAQPPLVRALLAALCTSSTASGGSSSGIGGMGSTVNPGSMTIPTIHREYNIYAPMIHLPPLTKDVVRTLADQAAGYMLLIKQDDTLYCRRRADPDKVTYRLNCSAVNMLRVPVG